MNELFDAAIQADRSGEITVWLVGYLRGIGRNEILADGLEEDGQYCSGLIDYPLGNYRILMGPGEQYRYPEDPGRYEERITAMVSSIREGWKPVPLIASDLWNEDFELNDGTHRAEALLRCGVTSYPTACYFKSESELNIFLAKFS